MTPVSHTGNGAIQGLLKLLPGAIPGVRHISYRRDTELAETYMMSVADITIFY